MTMKVNHEDKITRLRLILAKRGLTQSELSEMADVEKYQVSLLCSGRRSNVMLSTAKKIAVALDVTLDEAFGDWE